MLNSRALLALVAVAAVAFGIFTSGADASNTPRQCGTVIAAGKSWTVYVRRFDCATARAIVKKLAVVRAPTTTRKERGILIYPGVYSGLYSGLTCFSTDRGKLPTSITCNKTVFDIDRVSATAKSS